MPGRPVLDSFDARLKLLVGFELPLDTVNGSGERDDITLPVVDSFAANRPK